MKCVLSSFRKGNKTHEKVCVSTKSQPRHHYAKIHDYDTICAHHGGFKIQIIIIILGTKLPSSQLLLAQ